MVISYIRTSFYTTLCIEKSCVGLYLGREEELNFKLNKNCWNSARFCHILHKPLKSDQVTQVNLSINDLF